MLNKGRLEVTVGGVAFDLKLTVLIVLATLLPMTVFYLPELVDDPVYDHAYKQVLLFFVVPMVVICLVFRDWPAAYGFRIGKWREGLRWLAVVCPIMAVILWLVARNSDMQQWYEGRAQDSAASVIYVSGVELFAWEYLWRGLYLFGLARVVGPGPAIFLQAVPFALLHIGKPGIETFSTIFGGAGFGFIAWRTQSFVYGWLIHWFILVALVLLAT